MLIQDLQYIDNINYANKVKGLGPSELEKPTVGNFGAARANSYALGANTYTESGAKVKVRQGVSSTAFSYAIGLSFSD